MFGRGSKYVSEVLQEKDINLFGVKFRDDWMSPMKTSHKYTELFRKEAS